MYIALATNQEYPNLLEGEVLPLEAFSKAGYDAEPAVWNDPSVEWRHFDHIILRGCWGYHRQAEEFSSWLDKVGALGVTVIMRPRLCAGTPTNATSWTCSPGGCPCRKRHSSVSVTRDPCRKLSGPSPATRWSSNPAMARLPKGS